MSHKMKIWPNKSVRPCRVSGGVRDAQSINSWPYLFELHFKENPVQRLTRTERRPSGERGEALLRATALR